MTIKPRSPFTLSSFDWHDIYWCVITASQKVNGPAKTALMALAEEFRGERDRQKEREQEEVRKA